VSSPQELAASTYNAASDTYEDPALSFWDRYGRRTVERLELEAGASVLDVCCGTGASALPAAAAVGPGGRVLGVDLSEKLLGIARAKSVGLPQVEFRQGDMEQLDALGETFDAVVCVFGIFFLPDMPAALRKLAGRVGPGGSLAVTTWGPRLFEPGNSAFWAAIRAESPELDRAFNPWDRIAEPQAVRALFEEAGMREVAVEPEAGVQPLSNAEDFWKIVLGSGYRGTLDKLAPSARERVRDTVLRAVQGVDGVETNVLYAVARP